MKIISFITEYQVTQKILEHLGLWAQKPSRDPPNQEPSSENSELTYEPFHDDWPGYEEPSFIFN
jgi:hypothetical protein